MGPLLPRPPELDPAPTSTQSSSEPAANRDQSPEWLPPLPNRPRAQLETEEPWPGAGSPGPRRVPGPTEDVGSAVLQLDAEEHMERREKNTADCGCLDVRSARHPHLDEQVSGRIEALAPPQLGTKVSLAGPSGRPRVRAAARTARSMGSRVASSEARAARRNISSGLFDPRSSTASTLHAARLAPGDERTGIGGGQDSGAEVTSGKLGRCRQPGTSRLRRSAHQRQSRRCASPHHHADYNSDR